MKKETLAVLTVVYSLFFFLGSLCMAEEKTLILGSSPGWSRVKNRSGVEEFAGLRPHPVMALSSARTGEIPALDIAVSFDEGSPAAFRDTAGHYTLEVLPGLSAAESREARIGGGAAVFSGAGGFGAGEGPLAVIPQSGAALFSPLRSFGDFTIEFWLYPANAENGEQILSWTSTRKSARGGTMPQRIRCGISENRMSWTFRDFFAAPGDDHFLSLALRSSNNLVPKVWSHHLIRFDSNTGMIEYLVNGNPEDITYATLSGREDGEVCNPATGDGGRLILGTRFTGMIDEFRIHSRFVERAELGKYPSGGGSFVTEPIYLGEGNSGVTKIEAFGGRLSLQGGKTVNEYTGDRRYNFSDAAAMRFFIRAADNPYLWTGKPFTGEPGFPWIPFSPGAALPPEITGRWIEVAVVLYPSGDRETTPYIDEIRVHYVSSEAPPPPLMVQALPGDGAVELSWRPSAGRDVSGYMVYYGTSRGEYFGGDAVLGPSPLNVGKRNSIRIDGLVNGRLYYFTIAAYAGKNPPDINEKPHIGEFSREVSARPLRMVP